jgi:hypothetical protein
MLERIEVSFLEATAVIFQFAAAARLALVPIQLLKVWVHGGGVKLQGREAGYFTPSWLWENSGIRLFQKSRHGERLLIERSHITFCLTFN